MVPKIQMTVSRTGVESINIQATNDREKQAGKKLLEEIRPLVELMDRLLEKTGNQKPQQGGHDQ